MCPSIYHQNCDQSHLPLPTLPDCLHHQRALIPLFSEGLPSANGYQNIVLTLSCFLEKWLVMCDKIINVSRGLGFILYFTGLGVY